MMNAKVVDNMRKTVDEANSESFMIYGFIGKVHVYIVSSLHKTNMHYYSYKQKLCQNHIYINIYVTRNSKYIHIHAYIYRWIAYDKLMIKDYDTPW